MPARTAYPTARDLYLALTEHGLTLTRAQENALADQVDAGRREFERRCDRVFLAVAGARLFDPPVNRTNTLLFGRDLTAITSIVYQPTDAVAENWVSGTDYRPLPASAAADGIPLYGIAVFRRRWYHPIPVSIQQSITVTGTWGYGTTIPHDAWEAMLWAGALEAWTQINHLATSGISAWSDGDRRVEYERGGASPSGFELMMIEWKDRVEKAIQRYRRYAC